MKKWMKLAARNILRNKRRSLVTLLAIGVGFAAITVFRGYVSRVYWGLERMAIQGEGLGHLTIFREGWLEKGKLDPDRYMFSKAETEKIMKLAVGEKEVMLATPQITLSGIVSNGYVSTIFLAQGVVPQDDRTIKGTWTAFRPVQGEVLDEKKIYGVEMAQDLAKFLNLSPGKDGVVMAPTMSGQMNAMDIQVSGVFDTGTDATNDKFMRFPFVFAQSLLDTEKAEKIVVLLDETAKTELMRSRLLGMLANAGIPCEIRTWKELSMFFAKVRQMFDIFFMFVFCIVLVIVVMSTVNTMGMAVLERTREIGTLRALGLKRRGVSMLFAMEGSLLGVFGSLIGIVLHACAWILINGIKPTYVYPGSSSPVPLEISFVPETLLGLMCCLTALSLIAAIIPARRAARQNIVNALGHT